MNDEHVNRDQLRVMNVALRTLLTEPKTVEELELASRIIVNISLAELQISETEKAVAEKSKIDSDISTEGAKFRSEERRNLVSVLAPLLTTVVLVATLIIQTSQNEVSERHKRDAEEDVRWGETLKTLSGEIKGLSPGVLALKRFFNSPRYKDVAKTTSQSILSQLSDFEQFKQLYLVTYGKTSRENLQDILQLNRSISNQLLSIPNAAQPNVKFTPTEQKVYNFVSSANSFICSNVGPMLRVPRSNSEQLDFHGVNFYACDLSGVSFNGVNLENAIIAYSRLANVDFVGATNYENLDLKGSDWWHARRMERQMLDLLTKKYPFRREINYAEGATVSEPDYAENLNRLARTSESVAPSSAVSP